MSELVRLHQFNVNAGPDHEGAAALPADVPPESDVRLLAFYLPQFHTIAENDEWWGTGFTEWTNVTRALPRFAGHQQPRLPADLGFYDLANPDVLRRQAELARRAGISGFCIHNYWFSGRTVLDRPIETLLADPSIDMPFCIDWANENWTRRWDGREDDVLLQQRYTTADAEAYADYLARFLSDPRYITVDGRPLILFYRPSIMPDAKSYVATFRARVIANGFPDPYMAMVQTFDTADPRPFGIESAVGFPPHHPGRPIANERRWVRMLDPYYAGTIWSYEAMARDALAQRGDGYPLFPGVVPSWDNECRRPGRSVCSYGHSPVAYGRWLREASAQARAEQPPGQRLVFINAWNEWAEGAYLEPDRHFGFGYLAETRRVVDELNGARHDAVRPGPSPHPFPTRGSIGGLMRNLPKLVRHKIAGRPANRTTRGE